MFKSIENSAELQQYLFKTGVNEHPLQKELREYTENNLSNARVLFEGPLLFRRLNPQEEFQKSSKLIV